MRILVLIEPLDASVGFYPVFELGESPLADVQRGGSDAKRDPKVDPVCGEPDPRPTFVYEPFNHRLGRGS